MSEVVVDVFIGGLRRMVSSVVASAGRCLLVDPGYFPREIAELGGRVQTLGSLKTLVVTHSHWDRLPAYAHFPDTRVWASETLVKDLEKMGDRYGKNLEQARRFDQQWYIERPGPLRWPKQVYGISDEEKRKVGDVTIRFLLLPGHSSDSLGFLIEESNVLVAGDYLSPCEIPDLDDFDEYYRTLHRLAEILDRGVAEVIPGRGWKMSGAEARQVARDDLAYLYQLMFFRDSGDWKAAANMLLPRLSEDPQIRKLHTENLRRVGAPIPLQD